jgi:precorrin-2 dehydrogenase/sirohydrochlorin ferrochelatase
LDPQLARLTGDPVSLGSDGGGSSDAAERVTWIPRGFEEGDTEGHFLVVAATDDPPVNRRVARSAKRRGALVNVVDDPALCDFFVPSVLHRGPLQVAVSTGGVAPGLAMRLRRRFEQDFPDEWADAVSAVGEGRKALLSMGGSDAETRRRSLAALAALEIADLLDRGGAAAVAAAVDALIDEASASCTSPPSE